MGPQPFTEGVCPALRNAVRTPVELGDRALRNDALHRCAAMGLRVVAARLGHQTGAGAAALIVPTPPSCADVRHALPALAPRGGWTADLPAAPGGRADADAPVAIRHASAPHELGRPAAVALVDRNGVALQADALVLPATRLDVGITLILLRRGAGGSGSDARDCEHRERCSEHLDCAAARDGGDHRAREIVEEALGAHVPANLGRGLPLRTREIPRFSMSDRSGLERADRPQGGARDAAGARRRRRARSGRLAACHR